MGAGQIADVMGSKVRPILNLVNDLRKIGMDQRVPIPQIAVMGVQSSGKSSVLEAISGIEFPRGSGLVTRCADSNNNESWKLMECRPARGRSETNNAQE